MANSNAIEGLVSVMRAYGGGEPFVTHRPHGAADATPIYPGDALQMNSSAQVTATGTPGTTLWFGVALGYAAANSTSLVIINANPDAVYQITGDGTGTLEKADVGLNANLVLGAGSPAGLRSGHKLAENSKAATATLDLRILDFSSLVGNEEGAGARVFVRFNKSFTGPYAAAGV